jgi:glycosyltransferase involved in cell wall biosynthesis
MSAHKDNVMKILLVNKYWYLRGGTERVVFLTKKLLEEAGHTVEIFGMHHPKNTIQNEHFIDYIDYKKPSLRAALKSIYNTDARDKFKALVEEFQPDVVHLHNMYHQLSFSLLDVLKKKKIHTVMTLHDYKMLSPNYTLFHHGNIDVDSLGKKYYSCVLNNCMESIGKSFASTVEAYFRKWKKWQGAIDHYISPSVFMKDLCVKAGWNAEQIKVVPNPIDLTTYTVSKKEGEYVAYIGRISKEKGIDILLKAAKQTPDISYRIVGDGPEKNTLETYVKNQNIKNVVFDGWQSGKKLADLIDNARIIVVPSVWYENCPLSILETMAVGKIIIGSDIGGISELLPKHLLVHPKDVGDLVKLIQSWYGSSSQKRREEGSFLAQKVLKRHATAGYVKDIIKVYQSV